MHVGTNVATLASITLCLIQCAITHPAAPLVKHGIIQRRQGISDPRNAPGNGSLGQASTGSLLPAPTSKSTNKTVDEAIKDALDDPTYTSISPSLSAAIDAEWASYFSLSPSESSFLAAEYAAETSLFGDASYYPTSLSPQQSSFLEAEFEAEASIYGDLDDSLTDLYGDAGPLYTAIPASESSFIAAELAALTADWPLYSSYDYADEPIVTSQPSLLGGGTKVGLIGTFQVPLGGGGPAGQLAGVEMAVPDVTPITPITLPSSFFEPTAWESTPPEVPPTTPAVAPSITPPPAVGQPSGRRRRIV